MPRRERFIAASTAEALHRQESDQRAPRVGPVVSVVFDSAGVTRAIAHGLGVVPTGRDMRLQTGAVYDVTPERWTTDLTYLVAPVAPTFARLQFYADSDGDTRV